MSIHTLIINKCNINMHFKNNRYFKVPKLERQMNLWVLICDDVRSWELVNLKLNPILAKEEYFKDNSSYKSSLQCGLRSTTFCVRVIELLFYSLRTDATSSSCGWGVGLETQLQVTVGVGLGARLGWVWDWEHDFKLLYVRCGGWGHDIELM